MSSDGDGGPANPEQGDKTDGPVRDIVDRLEDCSQADTVALDDLVKAFGTASFVSTMMVPALLVVSPLSGIPFFSSVCGLTIALIAAQMLFKRTHLYLPAALTRRTIEGDKLRPGLKKMRGFADFLDRHTHKGRLRRLVGNGGRIVPQLLCLVAGLSMPLLELVPFSSSILGLSVLSSSIALLTRDGAFVLVGLAIMAGAAAVPIYVF
jgi:hypothetical protein